jgi:hypothetical protein
MLGRKIIIVMAAATLSVIPALARSPLLDEQRGILTLAPMREKVTPAVVNISVSTAVAGQDNPLLRDPLAPLENATALLLRV